MTLEGRGLVLGVAGRRILREENVRCDPGRMTALVGPSGSGKTTLLHCLGLLLVPDEGGVYVDGHEMTRASMRERRQFWRDRASFVLQDHGIIDDETVAFNVTLRRRSGTRDDARLAGALTATSLDGRAGERAGVLSGGEKQRLALARAIHKRSSILLVDEPTASLDEENRRRVIRLISDFARSGNVVVISTHDTAMIDACDSIHEVGGAAHQVVPPGRTTTAD